MVAPDPEDATAQWRCTPGKKDTDFSVSKELTLPLEVWAQGI